MTPRKTAVVIAGATGDANIGAAARAMKNFGLRDLRLVACCPHLTKTAYMYAVQARDVLESARVFSTLEDALEESSLAVAFTRRSGKLRRCRMDVSDLPAWVSNRAGKGGVALVFGREDKGLTNAEVRLCDVAVRIPSSSELPSLNLAQSVLVAAYELFRSPQMVARAKALNPRAIDGQPVSKESFVSKRDVKRSMRRIESALDALGYEDNPGTLLKNKILHQLERIFGRAGLTPRDAGMLDGLSARIIERAKGRPPKPSRPKRP